MYVHFFSRNAADFRNFARYLLSLQNVTKKNKGKKIMYQLLIQWYQKRKKKKMDTRRCPRSTDFEHVQVI